MRDSRRKPPLRPQTTHANQPGTPSGDDSDQRFRRRHRISDASGYDAVFANASRSRDALFTVLYRRRSAAPARLGLAVSKKHCRRATGRNRIKRLIRESFRRNKRLLTGLDLVVMNTRATHAADNQAIRASLARHFARCADGKQSSRRSRT